MPGAALVLEPDREEARKLKLKKQDGFSDARGEFAFRVPAVSSRYTLRLTRKGFVPQNKAVAVSGDERIDLSIQMEPVK